MAEGDEDLNRSGSASSLMPVARKGPLDPSDETLKKFDQENQNNINSLGSNAFEKKSQAAHLTLNGCALNNIIIQGELKQEYQDCVQYIGSSQLKSGDSANYRNLTKTVNDHSRLSTKERILEGLEDEDLHDPKVHVFPQMHIVKRSDYYKGGYNPSTINQQKADGNKMITFNYLMKTLLKSDDSNSGEVTSFTFITAPAGMGKTTLMRRIAQKALRNDRDGKMILYIEMKNMEEKTYVKPSSLLFDGLYSSANEEEETYRWLVNNPEKAIFIFDGLDQARWKFDEKKDRDINAFSVASTSSIVRSIFSRRIFAEAQLIVSSREFKLSELPAKVRPDRIIALVGLKEQDAKKLFIRLNGDGGERLYEKVATMSPRLLNLITVPVFLILTVIVMVADPTNPPPTTVTELYNRIISSLQRSEMIQNEKILEIIHKLKAMAYKGMVEGRFSFYHNDLNDEGVKLSTEEVQDLMMKVPSGKNSSLVSQRLMEGDFVFYFCHQTMQEFFAASYITGTSLEDFKNFLCRFVSPFFLVRNFLAGIIFGSGSEIHQVSHQRKKQEIYRHWITSQLHTLNEPSTNTMWRMQIYSEIFESDSDDLMKKITALRVSHPLSRDQAWIIGSLIARIRRLKSLNLQSCYSDVDILEIISKCVQDRIMIWMNSRELRRPLVNVDDMYLDRNDFSAEALRSFLGLCQNESQNKTLEWKIVYFDALVHESQTFKLTKEGDVIKIIPYTTQQRLDKCEGDFNVKESKLVFRRVVELDTVLYIAILFNPRCIEIPDQQLYVKPKDLREISKTNIKKMSKILLDCTHDITIDWELVVDSAAKYEVEVMHIAVDNKTSAEKYNCILKHLDRISGYGVQVTVHWTFAVTRSDNLQILTGDCQQKKIGNIRCHIRYRASLDDILLLYNNSGNITLIFTSGFRNQDVLTEEKLKKVEEISQHSSVLTDRLLDRDAWLTLDLWYKEQNRA